MENNIQPYNENRKQRALKLIEAIRSNIFKALIQLKELADEELYKDIGYHSLRECCEVEFNLKKSTAYNYIKVAEKFLPDNTEEISKGDSNVLVQRSGIFHMPASFEKLTILSTLPKEQTLNLISTGKITIRGKVYTIEQINSMSRDKLRSIVKGNKKERVIDFEEDVVPFLTAYKRAEKAINIIMNDLKKCDLIPLQDKLTIQSHINAIAAIYDKHHC